jgi:hypothetical protein
MVCLSGSRGIKVPAPPDRLNLRRRRDRRDGQLRERADRGHADIASNNEPREVGRPGPTIG